MSHQLLSPAAVVRSSADTVRRIAASFRRRGDARYAEHLEQRAARSEERARYLDEITRSRSARQGPLEQELIAKHEAAVRALEAG